MVSVECVIHFKSSPRNMSRPAFRRRKAKPDTDDNRNIKHASSAAKLCIERELIDLDLPDGVTLVRTPEDPMYFLLSITTADGYWRDETMVFKLIFPTTYPWDGIKCTCLTPIFHPNIDVDGNICLNILRPWNPTYTVQMVIFGLLFLLSDPNANDALNTVAGTEMRERPDTFVRHVNEYIHRNAKA